MTLLLSIQLYLLISLSRLCQPLPLCTLSCLGYLEFLCYYVNKSSSAITCCGFLHHSLHFEPSSYFVNILFVKNTQWNFLILACHIFPLKTIKLTLLWELFKTSHTGDHKRATGKIWKFWGDQCRQISEVFNIFFEKLPCQQEWLTKAELLIETGKVALK